MPLSQMRGDPAWDRAQVATPLESQEIFLVGQIARCDEKLTSKTCCNYSSSFSFDVLLSFASYRASYVCLLSHFSPFFPQILSFSLFALSLFFTIFSFTITVQFAILFASLFVSHVSFFFCLPPLPSFHPFSFFIVPFCCHYHTVLFSDILWSDLACSVPISFNVSVLFWNFWNFLLSEFTTLYRQIERN